MGKEGLENLTVTGYIEGKRSSEKLDKFEQRQKGIVKEQVLLRETKDKKLRRAMISHLLKAYRKLNKLTILVKYH